MREDDIVRHCMKMQ